MLLLLSKDARMGGSTGGDNCEGTETRMMEADSARTFLSTDPASTSPTQGIALTPHLAPFPSLQTATNANRTPKNLNMIETQMRSLNKSTVCTRVNSTRRYSMTCVRFTDEADPLGRKKGVSKDVSTSYSASDWTQGEGWRTDDSYRRFVTDAQGSGPEGRIDDEVCVNDVNPPDDEIVDIVSPERCGWRL